MTEDDRDLLVLAKRPGSTRIGTWWGRAFLRGAEETAYAESDLRGARRLARGGAVGAVMVLPGMASALVARDGEESVVAQIKVDRLDSEAWEAFRGEVRREVGFLADLAGGRLSPELIEAADELGVEVFPGSADFGFACACEPWIDPCVHALAVLCRLAWALDADPVVLMLLRGRSREWVIEAPDELGADLASGSEVSEADLDAAAAAAADLLAEVED